MNRTIKICHYSELNADVRAMKPSTTISTIILTLTHLLAFGILFLCFSAGLTTAKDSQAGQQYQLAFGKLTNHCFSTRSPLLQMQNVRSIVGFFCSSKIITELQSNITRKDRTNSAEIFALRGEGITIIVRLSQSQNRVEIDSLRLQNTAAWSKTACLLSRQQRVIENKLGASLAIEETERVAILDNARKNYPNLERTSLSLGFYYYDDVAAIRLIYANDLLIELSGTCTTH